MAGSIEENKIVYKKFKYIPPAKPTSLLDNTCFTLDFTNRKFVHIGLDPTNDFNVVIHLITASRYVIITHEFLKRVYSMMGHILSIILDPPSKIKIDTFLRDDSITITKMVYRGENNLVIESKHHAGCRVLLDRENLLALQDLETSILQSVSYKTSFIRPIIMNQIKQIHEFLNYERARGAMPMIFEEVKQAIIRCDMTSPLDPSFMSQLKLIAVQQIAERWYGHDEVDHKVITFIHKHFLLY